MKFTTAIVVLGASVAAMASPVYVPRTERSLLMCGTWSVQHGGPNNACGSQYTYTAGDETGCASNGSNCLDICCTPNNPQLCGDWSVKNGGPINSCGSGYSFTATDEQVCASNGQGCKTICCTKSSAPPQQTCGQWAVKFGGSPNACGDGYVYSASSSAKCNADNSNCQAQCCKHLLY